MKSEVKKYGSGNSMFPFRRLMVMGIHLSVILGSSYLALLIRFDGEIPAIPFHVFLKTLPVVVFIQFLFISCCGLNQGLWRYAGPSDVVGILKAVFGGSIVLYLLFNFILKIQGYPLSIYIIDGLILVSMLSGLRMTKRVLREFRFKAAEGGRRVLIIGAGDAGESLLRDMKQNVALPYYPVGFVDDDPIKKKLRIRNVSVLGNRKDLSSLVVEHSIEELIVCIPSATAKQMREIVDACNKIGIPVKTLPPMGDILDGKVGVAQIREVRLEDLLAREVIQTDLDSIRSGLFGKRVLVTGAAGSIGSELCRQVANCSPERISLLDQCENRLYFTMLELKEKFPNVLFEPIVRDIRNKSSIEEVVSSEKPEIIYHAAAYKHLPLMELNPLEAVKNNIIGTWNMASVARSIGVKKFVLISTDKAVNPTSIMGASKRLAECLVQGFAYDEKKTIFTIVRFGNVLGSNGSVVPIFQKQIKKGGPVTVTHPEIKRFFMIIPEAVQLVLQASEMGRGGEIFVLDMGEQIKIMDLARNLIALSGYRPDEEIPIQITGLRPGEKLYEELFDSSESIKKTQHPRISIAAQTEILNAGDVFRFVSELEEMIEQRDIAGIMTMLQKTVPSYQPTQLVYDKVFGEKVRERRPSWALY